MSSDQYDAELLRHAVLDVLVPEAQAPSVEEVISNANSTSEQDALSLVPGLVQRRILFFDETVTIYAGLRIPYLDATNLQDVTKRLSLSVDVGIVGALQSHQRNETGPREGPDQARESLATWVISSADDPLLILEEGDEGSEQKQTALLVWTKKIVLGRPKQRLHGPVIVFRTTGYLRDPVAGPIAGNKASTAVSEQYLMPGVPRPMNLFGSFRQTASGQALTEELQQTPASPLVQIPAPRALPIRTLPRRSIRFLPALIFRIRYLPRYGKRNMDAAIAALEIEIPNYLPKGCRIAMIKVQSRGEMVSTLNDPDILPLPQSFAQREIISFLYDLRRTEPQANGLRNEVLEIMVDAKVIQNDGEEASISVRWETGYDFDSIFSANDHAADLGINKLPEPNESGIQTMFTVSKPITVGKIFTVILTIFNRRSDTQQINVLTTNKSHANGNRSSSAFRDIPTNTDKQQQLEALTNYDTIYDRLLNRAAETTAIAVLTADLRLGLLNAGSAIEVELHYVALRSGLLSMPTVSIQDAISGSIVSELDLPEVHVAQ